MRAYHINFGVAAALLLVAGIGPRDWAAFACLAAAALNFGIGVCLAARR